MKKHFKTSVKGLLIYPLLVLSIFELGYYLVRWAVNKKQIPNYPLIHYVLFE